MTLTGYWRVRVIRIVLVSMVAVVGIGSIIASRHCPPPCGDTIEKTFLAFQINGTREISVQWTANGVAWNDGNFPASVTVNSPVILGVGAASDYGSIAHVVSFTVPNAFGFVWGFGPEIWDNDNNLTALVPPASAPSLAYIGDNRYLVAFRRGDGTIAVSVFDDATRDFVIRNVAPNHLLNSGVSGRPAVTHMNGRAVLVWRRSGALITAAAVMQGGIPTNWTVNEVSLPTTAYQAGVSSDPDVSFAGGRFFLAVVRKDKSTGTGGSTLGWDTSILQSSDGLQWQSHSNIVNLSVNNQTHVNIAGRTNGDLIVAAVKRRNCCAPESSVARFSGGQWRTLNAASVFGSDASFKQFALISQGDL